jgi:4-diphosphocytidyl-2-C-methyl-D-erythritol kinase
VTGLVEVTHRAHAKINVLLRVLGMRDDGYHDIESLVLPVSLHDLVVVRPGDGLTVMVSGERAAALEASPEENLVLVAARALASAAGIEKPAAEIEIDKRIPVAAGLGGGSADAAAALHALNELWGCGLDLPTLSAIAAGIGSDVPALLAESPAYIAGRGERVEPVHAQQTTWVLAPLPFPIRTPDAYAWWDADGATGPDPGALIAAAESGNDELLGSGIYNDLQAPVSSRHPEIGATIDAFMEAGALGAIMSGSGPTVAALARYLQHADRLAEAVPGSIVVSAVVSGSASSSLDLSAG